MKLSDLVRLRNRLKTFGVDAVKNNIEELDGLLSQVLTLPMHSVYRDSVDDNIRGLEKLEQSLSNINQSVNQLINNINQEIVDLSKEYLARGYLTNGFYGSNSADVRTEREDRLMPISNDARSEIIVKIRSYTDWKYPSLEIGPGDGVWTEHLVAADPLYIVDVFPEFIESTLSKFNPVYRNRVRPYILKSHSGPESFDLSVLPQNQMGFVFAWNVFDYMPLQETTAYLKSIYNVLRPGGVAMFSFNNCNVPQCVEYMEQGFRAWMTSELLTKTCSDLGFEIIEVRNCDETVYWIEIRKPGELKTVKAHQVLGKIITAQP